MKMKNTKIYLVIIGLASLIWFFIRVIPKPSRAFYPCQRAAFPIASAFIIWILGAIVSARLFRHARTSLQKKNYLTFSIALITGVICFFIISSLNQPNLAQANSLTKSIFQPSDSANSPMGEAKGIYPGRVVWAYNPDATNWDGKTGYWWSDSNINQIIVENMISESLQKLTGTNSDPVAWDSLFHYFNRQHLKGNIGYSTGHKIAIKINMNNSGTHDNYTSNIQNSSPQVVLAILKQLVNSAGVNASNITFYDVSRSISGSVYDLCKASFPDVNFVDIEGNDGRIKFVTDSSCQIKWSQNLTLETGGGNPTYLPTCVTQADYIINLANLKGHNLAGISLCSKNHFGSILSKSPDYPDYSNPQAAGVHPYATVHDFPYWNFPERAMKTYNTIVDLMGHKDLGRKTLLFMVDGLYACPTQMNAIGSGDRWLSAPFNNDWPSSIFVSQDNVAIESVCLDFLRTEQAVNTNMTEIYGNVDNYLHEAALANNPPSGVVYAPDGNGIPIPSLGVHEHWTNASKKSYSRNLNSGAGIELVSIPNGLVYNEMTTVEKISASKVQLGNYPNPFRSTTQISYFLKSGSKVRLCIYNLKGGLVGELINKTESEGVHNLSWDAKNLPSGTYICRMFILDANGESTLSIKLQLTQ